jgi:hypothetical protein
MCMAAHVRCVMQTRTSCQQGSSKLLHRTTSRSGQLGLPTVQKCLSCMCLQVDCVTEWCAMLALTLPCCAAMLCAQGDFTRTWLNPDCGLKTRRWEEVIPSLANMVAAAAALRKAAASAEASALTPAAGAAASIQVPARACGVGCC